MKICYITGYYFTSNDGIGRYTQNLISEVKKLDSKLKIEIIAENLTRTSAPAPTRKPLFPPYIHKLVKPFLMEHHYFSRFRKTQTDWSTKVKPVDADVFHAVSPSEAVPAVLQNKRPLVTTFHDIIPLLHKPRYLFERVHFRYYSRVAQRSDIIIADSHQTKNDLISVLSIPKHKIRVVYPGIDTKKFFPKEKKKNDIKKIFYQGGLIRRKGVFEVVEAFKKLLSVRSDISLLIGGGGDEAFRLKEEVKRLGLTKYVDFLGFVPDEDLPQKYQDADIFVYPSQYEGFGYTPLEAMACGTPVITSNTSSIPEVVGTGAITVNPLDTSAISEAMEKLLSSESLRKKYAREGAAIALNYSQRKCAVDTYAVYKEL